MLFTLRNGVGNCILVAKIVILLTISHLADSNSNVHVGCLYEITFPLLFYIQFRYLIGQNIEVLKTLIDQEKFLMSFFISF